MNPKKEKEFGYSRKHDAYFYRATNEWVDGRCHDPKCEFCRNRPEKYLPKKVVK